MQARFNMCPLARHPRPAGQLVGRVEGCPRGSQSPTKRTHDATAIGQIQCRHASMRFPTPIEHLECLCREARGKTIARVAYLGEPAQVALADDILVRPQVAEVVAVADCRVVDIRGETAEAAEVAHARQPAIRRDVRIACGSVSAILRQNGAEGRRFGEAVQVAEIHRQTRASTGYMTRRQRRIVVRGKVQIEGRGEIGAVVAGIPRVGEQETRLPICGNRNTKPGRIEDRYPLEFHHHVSCTRKRVTAAHVDTLRLDAPGVDSRRASGQPRAFNGQRVVPPLDDRSHATKRRLEQDEIDILHAHRFRRRIERRRGARER